MSQYALRRGLFGLGLFAVILGISIPAHAQTSCDKLLPNPECEANPCECIDELRNCSPRPPGFNDKINELEAACDQCLAQQQQEYFISADDEGNGEGEPAPVCGDGEINAPDEQCDPPTPVPEPGINPLTSLACERKAGMRGVTGKTFCSNNCKCIEPKKKNEQEKTLDEIHPLTKFPWPERCPTCDCGVEECPTLINKRIIQVMGNQGVIFGDLFFWRFIRELENKKNSSVTDVFRRIESEGSQSEGRMSTRTREGIGIVLCRDNPVTNVTKNSPDHIPLGKKANPTDIVVIIGDDIDAIFGWSEEDLKENLKDSFPNGLNVRIIWRPKNMDALKKELAKLKGKTPDGKPKDLLVLVAAHGGEKSTGIRLERDAEGRPITERDPQTGRRNWPFQITTREWAQIFRDLKSRYQHVASAFHSCNCGPSICEECPSTLEQAWKSQLPEGAMIGTFQKKGAYVWPPFSISCKGGFALCENVLESKSEIKYAIVPAKNCSSKSKE